MSKILTFDQAKRLQALGISIVSDCGYVGYTKSGELVSRRKFKEDRDYQLIPSWIRVFTVFEALDWIREEKGIECGVYPIMIPIRDGLRRMAYAHSAFDLNNNCKRLQLDVSLVKIDTHSLASSALLDAVLTYLELSKEKKL